MGFKENLKSELAFQDMLVKELAIKTGISKRTLDNYLRDKHSDPTAENAVKIAHALGVSVEYLMTGDTTGFVMVPESSDLRLIINGMEGLLPEERLIVLDLINSLKLRLHVK